MYSDLLKSYNIHSNHSTTFSNLLVKYARDLNKKTANKCVRLFFDIAAFGLNVSSETYFESLVRVSGPVRKAMDQKCQKYFFVIES